MNKHLLVAAFILGFLALLISGAQIVEGSQTAYPLASGIRIDSPSNRTYLSGVLTLDVSVNALVARNIRISMTYSLDGLDNSTIPLTVNTRENSFQAIITGKQDLPTLPFGSHNITVFAQYTINNEIAHLDNNTIYFTVSDTIPPDELIPPTISNLSIENKTYNTTQIPFSFNIDKTASLISYCLDGQTNRTIAFFYDVNQWGNQVNTTITGLSEGSHNLEVYAANPAGKMGNSETIYFTVNTNSEQTNPEFSSWIILPFALVIMFILCFSVNANYHKQHHNLFTQTCSILGSK